MKLVQRSPARFAWVCWAIVSDTSTENGSDVARNGRSRPWASYQARIAARARSGTAGAGSATVRTIAAGGGMKLGAAFWIQRTGWPELRDAAHAVEASGFDSLWLDDHLLSDEGDWHDPK